MSVKFAAKLYALLIGGVMLFQLGLALGMPWGELAMGGAFPGRLPPQIRLVAGIQILLLGGFMLIVLIHSGQLWPERIRLARRLIWLVIPLSLISMVMNLITPSLPERLVWGPVTVILALLVLRVGLGARPEAS